MQEQHHALRSRMVHNHSSELHVGIDVYEADVRFRILRTRHMGTPSGITKWSTSITVSHFCIDDFGMGAVLCGQARSPADSVVQGGRPGRIAAAHGHVRRMSASGRTQSPSCCHVPPNAPPIWSDSSLEVENIKWTAQFIAICSA